jgi:glycosyltransferase involved in cell wall biosynthesis
VPRRKPVISIVTNTYNRALTLSSRLIPSILAQQGVEHARVEHLIVVDGPHREYQRCVREAYKNSEVHHRIVHLGRNSTRMLKESYGVVPLQVGCWLARAPYITCVADDDIMGPRHLEKTIGYLDEDPEIDFVYTGFIHRTATSQHIVQGAPPKAGVVASPVFRAKLLGVSNWELEQGLQSDWKLVERWLNAGIKYGYESDVTFEHFADH